MVRAAAMGLRVCQDSNSRVFVEYGANDILPMITEKPTRYGQNRSQDSATESRDMVAIAEEGRDIWMGEQNVGCTFGAGASDGSVCGGEVVQEVCDKSRWIGDVGFSRADRMRILLRRRLTCHVH